MPLQIGSTFVNVPHGALELHLWIIISEPSLNPEKVAIVNVSSWRDDAVELNDPSCIVNSGDHPFVGRKSYIYYRKSLLTTLNGLQAGLDGGVLQQRESCSEDFLDKVITEAANSDFTPNEIRELLQEQGLVD